MSDTQKSSLFKSGMIIVVATFMGRLFGFVREIFISAQYGTSTSAEAYFIAITIPTIMLAVIPGALNAVATPLFAEYRARGDIPGLQRLFNTVASIMVVATIILSAVGYFLAPQITSVLAPGFTGETRDLTIQLVGIIMPSIALVGLISIFWSYLNAQQHFLMPSLGPLVASLTVIISIFTLVPRYGIQGLAVGSLIGYGLQALIMYPTLRRQEIGFGIGFDLRHPGVRKFAILMIPIIIGMSINQLNVIVDRMLGSNLAEGRLAAYIYATKLYQLPIGIFVSAVTLPLFPVLSRYASEGETDQLVTTMWTGLRTLAFIMLPVSAIFIVSGQPIIQLLFERAEFTAESTAQTVWALTFLALALFPYAARDLMTRVLYSLQDTRTPVIVNTFTILLNVVFAVILVRYLDQGGLGLALALGATANLFIMLAVIKYKLGAVADHHSLTQLGRIAISTAIMAAVLIVAQPIIIAWIGQADLVARIVSVAMILIMAAVTYLAASLGLRVEVLYRFIDLVRGAMERFRAH